MTAGEENAPHLSVVVGAYDMARELPRTVRTLVAPFQRGLEALRTEIIVVDNASPTPVDAAALAAIAPGVRVVRMETPAPSPAAALNAAAETARGACLGIMVDGARMASPGLLSAAWTALQADPARVAASLGFHLGPDVQMRSVPAGYDAAAEDALLASVPWEADGDRLFDISVFAGSSRHGWFAPIAESNALFMTRALWRELGGFDERFAEPGGGYTNLDLWSRAVAASGGAPWILLGEGTFHQVHGGAATNGTAEARARMAAEYERLTGAPYRLPEYSPRFIGRAPPPRPRPSAAHEGADGRPRQVQAVRGRPFRVDLPAAALEAIQAGTLKSRYKGLRLAKNPFDLALYVAVLQRLRPATIIEVGTSEGGSAVWLADQCRALGLSTDIISIDRAPPALEAPGVRVFAGDAEAPGATFPHEAIAGAAHPVLVIEDSAHTFEATLAVLDYVDGFLTAGDMIVVEDGVVADLPGRLYARFEDGPNRAVAAFLRKAGPRYRIDEATCDTYGHNVTYCPNGWLVRTGD